MAAVPFGFSFGDFVAAIEVIHKAAQALRRSSGAQSNFSQAVADLETFEIVLRQVEALSPTTSSIQMSSAAGSLPPAHQGLRASFEPAAQIQDEARG
jgi:hypothetical protein